VFGGVPELERALAMIADDEVNHLSYCHEELLRLCAQGHRPLIERMLKQYAYAEIEVFRQVSLRFIDEIAAIPGWSPIKRGVLRFSAMVVYLVERTWTWRRMVRLAPPVRPNALGPMPARTTANAAL
jgi:hypothetical protein